MRGECFKYFSLLEVPGPYMFWVVRIVVFLLAVSGTESVEFLADSLRVLLCPA